MVAAATTTAPPTRKRPWYRLHLSTYLVALVPLGILVLTAVPGYTVDDFDAKLLSLGSVTDRSGAVIATFAGNLAHQEHGWPLVYLDRVVVTVSTGPPPLAAELLPQPHCGGRRAPGLILRGRWEPPGGATWPVGNRPVRS